MQVLKKIFGVFRQTSEKSEAAEKAEETKLLEIVEYISRSIKSLRNGEKSYHLDLPQRIDNKLVRGFADIYSALYGHQIMQTVLSNKEAEHVVFKGQYKQKWAKSYFFDENEDNMNHLHEIIMNTPDFVRMIERNVLEKEKITTLTPENQRSLFWAMFTSGQRLYKFNHIWKSLQNSEYKYQFWQILDFCSHDAQILHQFLRTYDYFCNVTYKGIDVEYYLVKLANYIDIIEIMMRIFAVQGIQKSQTRQKFAAAFRKRAILLFKKMQEVQDITEYKHILLESEAFKANVMAFGAWFYAQDKKTIPQLNERENLFKCEVFSGGNIVKNAENMEEESNYLQPEKFNAKTYQFLQQNIEATHKNAPKYSNILVSQIPKDLENPNAHFYVLTFRGEPIAIKRWKNVDEKTVYHGFFYVKDGYKKGFSIGKTIDDWTREDIGKRKRVIGTVLPENNAISRHLESNMAIYGFETEKAEINAKEIESELLFGVEITKELEYTSQNLKKYPKAEVIRLAKQNKHQNGIQFTEITDVNTEKGLREALAPIFDENNVITRLYYAEKKEKAYIAYQRKY